MPLLPAQSVRLVCRSEAHVHGVKGMAWPVCVCVSGQMRVAVQELSAFRLGAGEAGRRGVRRVHPRGQGSPTACVLGVGKNSCTLRFHRTDTQAQRNTRRPRGPLSQRPPPSVSGCWSRLVQVHSSRTAERVDVDLGCPAHRSPPSQQALMRLFFAVERTATRDTRSVPLSVSLPIPSPLDLANPADASGRMRQQLPSLHSWDGYLGASDWCQLTQKLKASSIVPTTRLPHRRWAWRR